MADENELKKNPKSFTDSASQSESNTKQETESRRFLDGELLSQILAGLAPNMTDDEISAFAENLLRPVLNAGLESAQQSYEATKLGKEQEIENLAATLSRSIAEQQNAYRQSAANVETAALSRGMGRSSYTMQTLANQGSALAKAVQQLTEENARAQSQAQQQITLAAQQNAQTQGRLNTDYATQLAAKIQELRESQRNAYNQNYLTAVSESLGNRSTMDSTTKGTDTGSSVSGDFVDPNANVGTAEKRNTASGGNNLVVRQTI